MRKVVKEGNVGSQVNFSIELQPGNYFWKVQAIDNTFRGSSFSQEKMFTIEPLGLQEKFFNEHFTLFPNPLNDRLTIKSDNFHESYFLKIYSLDGSLIHSSKREITQRSHSLDLSFMNSGIYLLQILSKKGIGFTKIAKE